MPIPTTNADALSPPPGPSAARRLSFATLAAAMASVAIASEPGLSIAGASRPILFAIAACTTAILAASAVGVALARGLGFRHAALAVTSAVFGALGSVFVYFATLPDLYSHGRRLRRALRVRIPATRTTRTAVGERDETRAIAAEWRKNAAREHAATASFAELSLDLVALGASTTLLAAIHRDALDEVRHTEACLAIAQELDGAVASPVAFPAARALAPRIDPWLPSVHAARVAIDALVDGALNEEVSARILAALSRRASPRIAPRLRAMACDEARHARHSWAVVDHCLVVGGPAVRAALRAALSRLPDRLRGEIPVPARDGSWEHHGVQGEALERRCARAAHAHVTKKLARRLAA